MSRGILMIQRALGVGVTWSVLWWVHMAAILTGIGLVDPDSIDPGEIRAAIGVLGPMGLLSGLAFGLLSFVGRQPRHPFDLTLTQAVWRGLLGAAVVQAAYLDHGDAGLLANAGMALEFCVLGGVVTAAWLAGARRWSRRRDTQSVCQ